MKILKLRKEKLDLFASVVQQFGEVHAPVEQEGKYVFRRLTRWSEARLDYNRTILPPKKYFLPPRETLFRYRPGAGFEPYTDGLSRRIILFGVHACDVYALNILDRVFAGRYNDPYYQTRRRNTAIIGIDCTPDKHCFCRSMRADFVDHGFDLFFYDTGDYYQVLVGTALGDDMVLATGSIFEAVDAADIGLGLIGPDDALGHRLRFAAHLLPIGHGEAKLGKHLLMRDWLVVLTPSSASAIALASAGLRVSLPVPGTKPVSIR